MIQFEKNMNYIHFIYTFTHFNYFKFSYLSLLILIFIVDGIFTIKNNQFRANVTLKFGLSYDFDPQCDETVYKIVVCAGEFTNKCHFVGPVSRFIQASCASQGPPESVDFSVTSVEKAIELDVKVQKVGESKIQQLRGTQIRLIEDNEISVTTYDLSLILRFQVSYACLTNFYGKNCSKYCDSSAVEHRCDEEGNILCRPGYFMDHSLKFCRYDECLNRPDYCQNGGKCINNPNPDVITPICICPPKYNGMYCEFYETTSTTTTTTTTTTHTTMKPINQMNSHQKSHNQYPIRLDENLSIDQNQTDLNEIVPKSIRIKVPRSQNQNNLEFNEISNDRVQKLNLSNQQILNSIKSDTNHPYISIENDKNLNRKLSSTTSLSNITGNSSNNDKWRKIILITTIGIGLGLILTLICAGVLMFVIRRKPKKVKTKPQSISIINDANSHINPAKRWASVDQSPLRITGLNDGNYGHYNSSMNGIVGLNGSLGGINHASFIHTQNGIQSFGDSQLTSLHNPFERGFNFDDSLSNNPLNNNADYINDHINSNNSTNTNHGNSFATLPRNYYYPTNRLSNLGWESNRQSLIRSFTPQTTTITSIPTTGSHHYRPEFESNSRFIGTPQSPGPPLPSLVQQQQQQSFSVNVDIPLGMNNSMQMNSSPYSHSTSVHALYGSHCEELSCSSGKHIYGYLPTNLNNNNNNNNNVLNSTLSNHNNDDSYSHEDLQNPNNMITSLLLNNNNNNSNNPNANIITIEKYDLQPNLIKPYANCSLMQPPPPTQFADDTQQTVC